MAVSEPTVKVVMFEASLRDWFAGMALQGFVASDATIKPGDSLGEISGEALYAKSAYALADAMLAEREELSNG